MTPSLVVIVPGHLNTRTGGYIYDKRIVTGLSARGWRLDLHELDDSFPEPTRAALAHAASVLRQIPAESLVLVDGLAFGAMPEQVEEASSRLCFVALIHQLLADAVGLRREVAARLRTSEQRALASARGIVVTGHASALRVADYGVAPDRVSIVEPGTDPSPIARGSNNGPLQLLCVAAVTRGKGHDVLVRSLAAGPHRNWHLTCAGSLDRDRVMVDELRARLRTANLIDHVTFLGELGDAALAACYDAADVFVLATLHETFGMAVAEALARGLPVVSTRTGAIPHLVGVDAGIVVEPGNVAAFTAALSRMLDDTNLRARLRAGATRVRERLPTWDLTIDRMADALTQFAPATRGCRK